jgi:DNA-binding MarR family transcriptional regulator
MPATRDAVDLIEEQWRRERPDLDPSPMGVVGRISRLATLLQRELEPVFAQHGLTGADFDVLATLRRTGEPFQLPAGGLSRSTMITTGGMTKRLDRLESAGLVAREADPHDRRGRLVALTPEGLALVDRALESHLRNEERLLASLSPEQRGRLESVLREMLVALEGELPAAGSAADRRSLVGEAG